MLNLFYFYFLEALSIYYHHAHQLFVIMTLEVFLIQFDWQIKKLNIMKNQKNTHKEFVVIDCIQVIFTLIKLNYSSFDLDIEKCCVIVRPYSCMSAIFLCDKAFLYEGSNYGIGFTGHLGWETRACLFFSLCMCSLYASSVVSNLYILFDYVLR